MQNIKLLILDVDGVLTDGRLYYLPDGQEVKVFHVHDGQGIKLLHQAGINVAIISSRPSSAVNFRMQELGIKYIYLNQPDKLQTYLNLISELKISDHEVAYMGDDLPDLAVMKRVGFSIAVGNAIAVIKQQASYVTKKKGGYGAVREVCEMILSHSLIQA